MFCLGFVLKVGPSEDRLRLEAEVDLQDRIPGFIYFRRVPSSIAVPSVPFASTPGSLSGLAHPYAL
jgi:hypothetical protein